MKEKRLIRPINPNVPCLFRRLLCQYPGFSFYLLPKLWSVGDSVGRPAKVHDVHVPDHNLYVGVLDGSGRFREYTTSDEEYFKDVRNKYSSSLAVHTRNQLDPP